MLAVAFNESNAEDAKVAKKSNFFSPELTVVENEAVVAAAAITNA